MSATQAALDAAAIAGRLGAGSPIRLVVRERVGSTNDAVRELADAGAAPGLLVVAAAQSSGRGRMGRVWDSPSGLGLYLSMLFRPTTPPAEWTRWTIAASVAVATACRRVTGIPVGIRWPNDLYVDGRKLGGLLTEVRSRGDRLIDLIVGAGVNVAQGPDDFPAGLRDRATSLRLAGAVPPPSRESLAVACALELTGVAAALERGAWAALARRWETLAPEARGTRVRIRSPDAASETGRTAGLDGHGALRVQHDDGTLVAVHQAGSVVRLEEGSCC